MSFPKIDQEIGIQETVERKNVRQETRSVICAPTLTCAATMGAGELPWGPSTERTDPPAPVAAQA